MRLAEDLWLHSHRRQAARRDGGTLLNEREIRVASAAAAADGALELRVQLAAYKDFLFTNHAVANLDRDELDAMERSGPGLGWGI